MKQKEVLLTLKQACKLLNCHPNTLRKWDKAGTLVAIRFGKRGDRRYKKEDILAYIKQVNAKNSDEFLDFDLEHYKAIVLGADEAIIGKDLQGKITSWNPAAEIMYQYKAEEVIGRSIALIFPRKLLAEHRQIMQNIRKGQKIEHYQTVRKRKDEKLIYVSTTIYPIRNKQGRLSGAATITTDITKKKEIEQKLQFHADILRSVRDCVIVTDLQGHIAYWNKGAEKVFGYTSAEMLGKSPAILYPDVSKKIIKKEVYGFFQETDYRGEWRGRSRDGTTLWLDIKTTELRNTEKEIIGIISVAKDVTQKKLAEEREKFLLEASKLLSASLNYKILQKNISSLIIPHLSDVLAVHLFSNKGILEPTLIAPWKTKKITLIRQIEQNEINRVAKTQKSELCNSLKTDTAMIVPLVARGKTLGTLTCISYLRYNLDDLNMVEELGRRIAIAIDNADLYRKIRHSRDQLQVILEGVADGIMMEDINGTILYANRAIANFFGYNFQDELVNKQLSYVLRKLGLTDEFGTTILSKNFPSRKISEKNTDIQSVISYRQRGKKLMHWATVRSKAIYAENQHVQYIITIFHDTTEQIESERRKDEFIAIASHELKTPITSLNLYNNILVKKYKAIGNEETEKITNKMDEQLKKLTGLVKYLLDISKIRAGKLLFEKERFPLDDLVEEVVDDVSHIVLHKIVIKGYTDAVVYADKDRIREVLINLLTNAAKYSPHATKIIITTYKKEEMAIIQVTDFGIGIPEHEQRKIFNRFFQANHPHGKTFPGLGLGLYIAQEIISQHHGTIWVESKPDKGSTFSFSLPITR